MLICSQMSKEGNAKAVEILFSHFHNELKAVQLLVLSNFPEPLDPEVYAKLLPKILYALTIDHHLV